MGKLTLATLEMTRSTLPASSISSGIMDSMSCSVSETCGAVSCRRRINPGNRTNDT
ncbi:Uncharacterised protein [Bordetella pertussis]|nr:Uncharacterised protein [Bordetella pertussis]CPM69745.1 Uncharacterised protein [Bordetella pertussis]CPN69140.1 Uncharacterised protein [Bordetella pertussis]CPP10419.1 Uncharacterised protein [Bordetella pertussis]